MKLIVRIGFEIFSLEAHADAQGPQRTCKKGN